MDRLLLALRWVALAIALLLNLWGPAPVGFIHEPETAIFGLAAYNAAVSLALLRWRWLTPRRMIALDTVFFTWGLVAAGGWQSSLFALYFLVVLSSAIHLRVVESLGYTALVSLIYLAACVFLPNWSWDLASIEVLVGRVTTLLFAGLSASMLVQQIEMERRLRQGEQEINSRLMVLNDLMSLELGSELDLGRTLDGIARLARKAVSAEFSAVCLFPAPDNGGVARAFDGVPESLQESLFREAHLDPVGEIVSRTGQPLLIADVSSTALTGGTPAFYQARTLICVPIKLKEKVIGVLYNGLRTPDQAGDKEVELLMAMGRYTGLAIANAQMYDRERHNVEQLRELEQVKSEFLSAVSHQLRTPITSVSTSADLLLSSAANLTDDQHRLVQNIARNSVRLGNLVTDILEMARLKDGRLRLSTQPVSPLALVQESLAGIKLLFEAKDQKVVVLVDPELPRVEADRRKAEHVLANLLTNSCKFTQRGGTVAVRAGLSGEWVQFEVKDNGPGMDAEVRAKAFEPFYSAGGPEGQGGTGLGLAIARALVDLHKGRISLSSAPGDGTAVRFTLPVSDHQRPGGDSGLEATGLWVEMPAESKAP